MIALNGKRAGHRFVRVVGHRRQSFDFFMVDDRFAVELHRGDTSDDGLVSYSLMVEVDSSNDIQLLTDRLQAHPNIYLVERQ